MAKTIEDFKEQLLSESNDNKLSRLRNKLIKTCSDIDKEKFIELFIAYVKIGYISFWTSLIQTEEIKYVYFFK